MMPAKSFPMFSYDKGKQRFIDNILPFVFLDKDFSDIATSFYEHAIPFIFFLIAIPIIIGGL